MPVLTNRSKLLCHNRRCLLCSISRTGIISRHSPSMCSFNTLWRLDERVCTLDWSCQARPSRHDTVSGISNRSACGNLVANMKRMRAYLDFCAALGCMRSATDMYTHPVRLLQRLLEVLACRRALLALGPFSVAMEGVEHMDDREHNNWVQNQLTRHHAMCHLLSELLPL